MEQKIRKEERNYSPTSLPVSAIRNDLGKGEERLLLHWHDYIEIIYVREGEGVLQVDLENYSIKKGDLIFVSPRSLHGESCVNEQKIRCEVILADTSVFQGVYKDDISRNYISPFVEERIKFKPIMQEDHPAYARILENIRKIGEEMREKQEGYELFVKAILFDIIGVLIRYRYFYEREICEQKDLAKIKQAIGYMIEHYKEGIAVEEIAQITGYSKYYFMHFFKENTGYTTTQYRNLIRLEKAEYLLRSTDKSITEISEETGFEDISYFIRIFKKKNNCSPLQFRKTYTGS